RVVVLGHVHPVLVVLRRRGPVEHSRLRLLLLLLLLFLLLLLVVFFLVLLFGRLGSRVGRAVGRHLLPRFEGPPGGGVLQRQVRHVVGHRRQLGRHGLGLAAGFPLQLP